MPVHLGPNSIFTAYLAVKYGVSNILQLFEGAEPSSRGQFGGFSCHPDTLLL
jgi:hypothetical protein